MRFGYASVRILAQSLFRLGYGVSVQGIENVPRNGPVIFASNHRSNFDPPLLGSLIPREASYFAKQELFRSRLFGGFLRYLNAFPVRRGQFDRESLKTCLNLLAESGALIFFPEGTRAPRDGYLRAKIGLGWVICLSRAPILPIYLHGTASLNPRGLNRPGFSVIFGSAIPASELIPSGLRGHDLYQAVSDGVLERIRELSLLTPRRQVAFKGPIYDREIIENKRLR